MRELDDTPRVNCNDGGVPFALEQLRDENSEQNDGNIGLQKACTAGMYVMEGELLTSSPVYEKLW